VTQAALGAASPARTTAWPTRMADAIQASRSSPPTPAGGRSGSGPNGEWRDGDNSFLKVNVWRAQAEHLADSLSKGDRVMVTGRLRQRPFRSGGGCCIQSGRDALKQRSTYRIRSPERTLGR
jgi:hypothetical protein